MKTVKVAVTGAAGQIGYAMLFRLASGEISAGTLQSSCSCWNSNKLYLHWKV